MWYVDVNRNKLHPRGLQPHTFLQPAGLEKSGLSEKMCGIVLRWDTVSKRSREAGRNCPLRLKAEGAERKGHVALAGLLQKG